MARRVYADFDQELLQRLQNRTDITATQRGFFLSDAVQAIANEFPHPEYDKEYEDVIPINSETLVPSATDLWWPKFMKDMDNNRPIDLVAQEKIEGYRKVLGFITQFYWFNNTFWFDRLSSSNLNVRIWYKRTASDFTSGSPEFRQIFDPLVPMRAAQIGLSTVGDQTAAEVQEAEYEAYVRRAKLPTYENQKNDRRQSLRVRMR